jgi:hypothetical protein
VCGSIHIFGRNGAGSDRKLSLWLHRGVRYPPHVPQLKKKETAFVMNCLGQEFVTFNLLVAHDARTIAVTIPLWCDVCGLANNKGC